MDALYEAVAKRFLVVNAHGQAEVALSINGVPQLAGEDPGSAVSDAAGQAAPRAAAHAATDPGAAHALRQRGNALLSTLKDQVSEAFKANGVPDEVALQQAEDIVLCLADEALMAADKELGDCLEAQQVHQRGVNVCIDGRQVSFHKTTTFVAATPAQAPSTQASLTEEPSLTVAPPLTAVIDVTVSFEAKPAQAWRRALGPSVKCFGSDNHWLLEARAERATVRQAPGAGARSLREQLRVPAEPLGWRGAVAEWYRKLEAIFGRCGMVFNLLEFGRGAQWAPPARAQLAGIGDFVTRTTQAAGAQGVSAAPRGGESRRPLANYQQLYGRVWRDDLSVRPKVAPPPDVKWRHEIVDDGLQQLDPHQPILKQGGRWGETGAQITEEDAKTYHSSGWLGYQLEASPSSCDHVARAITEATSDVSPKSMKALDTLLSVDFVRTLFGFGRDYLMVNGVSLVEDRFFNAHEELGKLPSDSSESKITYSVAQLPHVWNALCESEPPTIDANGNYTRKELADALMEQAIKSVRGAIADKFALAGLERQVKYLVTQTFDQAVQVLATLYGAPALPDAGERRRCHITLTSLPEGQPRCTVRYERETAVQGPKHDAFPLTSTSIIDEDELEHGKVHIVTHWEVTPARFALQRATLKVDLERKSESLS
ncbi:hypothetical protein [Pandoraea sputorum]|nr:hypothetical protein [Pandoraea sputorum]